MRIIYNGKPSARVDYLEKCLQTAVSVATIAHDGQYDKGGHPYINHPLAVCRILNHVPIEDPRLKELNYLLHAPLVYETPVELELAITAILHDTLEDTSLTPEDLRRMDLPGRCIETVLILTRDPRESYSAYIERVTQSPAATTVKLADLTHNQDLSRLPFITIGDRQRNAKYERAMERLQAAAAAQANAS